MESKPKKINLFTRLIKGGHVPDILDCIANLSSDEVFTPPDLVDKILDLLPEEVWHDKNLKWLDPACKTGIFLRQIAFRLMNGLKDEFPDEEERRQHIFKNMLYGIALTDLTALMSRRSLYTSKFANGEKSIADFKNEHGNIYYDNRPHTYKNGSCIYCGNKEGSDLDRDESRERHAYNFIHLKKEELQNMKFDIVVGNPPYQLKDGGNGASAAPIYQLFVQQAKRLNPRYMAFIIPSRWFAGGKGLDDFRDEMLHDRRIKKLVDYPDASDCFPGVEIKGGVSYFIWENNYSDDCEITTIINGEERPSMKRRLDEYDILIRWNEAIPILRKVQALHENTLNKVVSSRKPFGLATNFANFDDIDTPDKYKIYANKKIGYVQKSQIHIDDSRPVVWFASYQDVLGKNLTGGIKERHKKMHDITWDCIFVDEYHFGAWRDSAKELTAEDGKSDNMPENYDEAEEIEQTLPIKSRGFLYLSGTPFRAIEGGEFTEDQIFNWTYADEQRAKETFPKVTLEGATITFPDQTTNPYRELPSIVMLTYQMPENLREVAMQGEFNEFDLNKFFSAEQKDGQYKFKLEKEVQKFLNILHGVNLEVDVDNRFDHKAPALPFEDSRLLSSLRHTFWFLPNVAACRAMENLLKNDPFFSNYTIIRAAGSDTPGGKHAKEPVENAIKDGLSTNTITLSCGKLTTGVTVPAWSGVLFLRNTDKPETYFQTAFRAQSPWVVKDTEDPMQKNILKNTCYVLDFAPSRALKLVADYSNSLGGVNDKRRPEERLDEFIHFLPILCYDGNKMTKLNATEILDISTYGTASTMLARRWQSARLIDTTTVVLEKILANEELLKALEKIEDFRNLREDLSKTITREKAIKETKKKIAEEGREATNEEKKTLTEQEKEQKSFKKMLREKLLKFITRIPVFMYLTDYREQALIDVIRNIEPELFTKVTGLTIHEFDMMCEVGAFNQNELNAAIAQFRRFEDASLKYAGGRAANDGEIIGLFDTTVTRAEADEIIEREI